MDTVCSSGSSRSPVARSRSSRARCIPRSTGWSIRGSSPATGAAPTTTARRSTTTSPRWAVVALARRRQAGITWPLPSRGRWPPRRRKPDRSACRPARTATPHRHAARGRTMIAGLIARARSLWTSARRPDQLEAEMREEVLLHQGMRAEDLVRSGLSRAEAARQARLEFGSPDRYQDEARESRGLHRVRALRVSWLDFKLGFRMLAKYPGITIVGGLAMAFAIWMGAAT